MKGTRWKQHEIDYLTKKWGTTSIENMSKRLGRSYDAIWLKADKLGLGGLVENVDGIPVVMLPEMIGVSYDNIQKIWIQKNKMPIKKVGRKATYVKETDLAKFMQEHTNLWDARECDKYYFYTYDWFNELLENERNGIHTNRYHRYTPQEDARIVFLHEVKGMSYRAIGKEFGVCQQAIHKRYKKIKKGA